MKHAARSTACIGSHAMHCSCPRLDVPSWRCTSPLPLTTRVPPLTAFLFHAHDDVQSSTSTYITTVNETLIGDGHEYRDAINQRTRIHAEFKASPNPDEHYLTVIERYDKGTVYTISSPPGTCNKKTVTGKMPTKWGWLVNATYSGIVKVRNFPCDLWAVRDDANGKMSELYVKAAAHSTTCMRPAHARWTGCNANPCIVITTAF
jgi:hypothetical protein